MIRLIIISLFTLCAQMILAQFKVDENTFGDIKGRQIGPATMSGRISALDAVDKNPSMLYIGAASGGLWKSKNYGTTFKPVFDKYNQSIGTITIDQNHPDTIWVGTGQVWVRNSTSIGDGVYKTTNAGESWQEWVWIKPNILQRSLSIQKILISFLLQHLETWNSSPREGVV